MICSKCRQSNSSYNNYCSNDGENLDNMPKKSTLQKSQNKYCLECGCEVKENINYCMNCGEMIEVVSQKSESFASSKINDFGTRFDSPKGFEFKLPKINLSNFSNVDKKGIVQSTILTLILSSIVIAIINTLLYQDSVIANQMQLGDTGISKFKLFMSSLAAMNVPNVKMVLKASFVSIFNISFVARTIIYPLIVGLFMYISSYIALKKENLEGKVLENSISCALLYSIIMVIVGFMGNYNLNIEEGAYMIISMNSFTLFINSFIISFIGTYLGMSRGQNDSIVVRFFKKSLLNILIGIGIIAIIVGVLVAVELEKNIYLSEVMRYYSFSSKMMLTIVSIVGLIILSCWLFTISNFVGISIFGITSYNIISLTKDSNSPIILLSIIPIVMLVLIGRKIKSIHGENQIKIIGIYSCTYSVSMFILSYFSRIMISLNSGQVQEYLNDFIYEMISGYSYEYADIIMNYLNNIYTNLSAGVYMGSSLFLTIIITFVFSFVFVLLGYKTKKIDNI